MFSFKSSHRRCSVKEVLIKISQISQENTCVGSLLNKVAGLQATEEYLRMTASVVSFSWHLCWSLILIKLQVFRLQKISTNDCFCSFFLMAPVLESLLNKLQVFRSATLLKWDFRTGVFLWNLWSFYEHLFWRISAIECFCSFFLMALCSLFTS